MCHKQVSNEPILLLSKMFFCHCILDNIICSLDPPWTAETAVSHTDVQFFFQDVYDKFQGAVQYNNDNTVSKDKILSLVKNKN